MLGTDKDWERADEGKRGASTVGLMLKGRPSSHGLARDAVNVEGESERWRELVTEHRQ